MKIAQCQLDSYQREQVVSVLSCVQEGTGYRIETDRSILFVGGGGQPEDYGMLGVVPIRVERSDCAGYTFRASEAIPEGEALMTLDWPRRFDHMQQHTTQHILTAVALREFGWNTLSFHLNPDRSDIVVDQPQVDWECLYRLEDRVNEIIRDARPVSVREMAREVVEAGDARYRRLPDDSHQTLRMIDVDGVDLNPCGGTHVTDTAHLQLIRLVAATSERGVQTRIHFLAGNRALAYGQVAQRSADALKRLLSCGLEEQPVAVQKLLDREKSAVRHARALEGELAIHLAADTVESREEVIGLRRVKAGGDFVNTFARVLEERAPDKVVIVCVGDVGDGSFTILGSEEALRSVGPTVCQVLDGRGGGRGRRYQGKATRPDLLDEAVKKAAQALEAAR